MNEMDRKGRKNGITIRQSFQMLNFLSFGLRWDILFTDLQLLRTPRFHRSKNVDENIQNFERIPDVWSKKKRAKQGRYYGEDATFKDWKGMVLKMKGNIQIH